MQATDQRHWLQFAEYNRHRHLPSMPLIGSMKVTEWLAPFVDSATFRNKRLPARSIRIQFHQLESPCCWLSNSCIYDRSSQCTNCYLLPIFWFVGTSASCISLLGDASHRTVNVKVLPIQALLSLDPWYVQQHRWKQQNFQCRTSTWLSPSISCQFH